ncbi:MAG: hypothetical protein IPJ39_17730, partial [Saprospiraceae bacterium]|nr:hypothetical protein [Saprospiraceae bacterium]
NPLASYGKLWSNPRERYHDWTLGDSRNDIRKTISYLSRWISLRHLWLILKQLLVLQTIDFNYSTSGTTVIEDLGDEHVRPGFPIVYTSVDSVFQIAMHEAVIPIEKQCKVAELQGTC